MQAQALIFGQVLLFGVDDHSNIVEFAMQVNLLDVASGNILWSSRTFADASTTWGQVLGVSEGPSVNDVAGRQRAIMFAGPGVKPLAVPR